MLAAAKCQSTFDVSRHILHEVMKLTAKTISQSIIHAVEAKYEITASKVLLHHWSKPIFYQSNISFWHKIRQVILEIYVNRRGPSPSSKSRGGAEPPRAPLLQPWLKSISIVTYRHLSLLFCH